MKDRMMKTAGMAAVAASVFMASGYRFFEAVVHCKRKKKGKNRAQNIKQKRAVLPQMRINHPRHKYEKEYEDGKAWCRAQKMQDCYIRSREGLLLHGYYFPAENGKRFVLLSHGYRGSGFGDFANIAGFLHENGCNLLFIDQRCCGESEGEYITFGAKEQYDVQRWAYYIAKRNKNNLPVYLYGTSMGAATVLMVSGRKLPREVKGIIADCGFHSMKAQLQDMAAGWFHLHWIGLLLLRVDWFCRLLAGFPMKEADTTRAMRRNKRPVLFFHGEKDTYVSAKNSKYHYALCRGPKELVLIPEARHLCCAYEAPELYRKKLLEFFEQYD